MMAATTDQYTAPLPKCTVKISRGENTYDNQPKQIELRSFGGLWDLIYKDRGSAKGQQYICAAMAKGLNTSQPNKFKGEAHWRQGYGTEPLAFLRTDADGMPKEMFPALLNVLDKFDGCTYTTSSHTPENPRARSMIALSRSVRRSESIQLGKAFERYLESKGIVGVEWDASVYQPEQQCYLPLKGAEFHDHKGGFALNVDALLNSPLADEVDTTGSTSKNSAVTEFSALSLEDQKALLEGIQSELQAHKDIVKTSGGYDTPEAKAQANVVNKLGASLCHCWVFDDSSLNAVCTELTRNDVNALNRNQWVSRVMLGARMAPVGSEDAESIKAAVRTWSERHSCYDGYLTTGNDQPEFEPHGGDKDPFKDFEDRWSEGERTTRTDNSPFRTFWYMANNRMPVPKVRLADGTDSDLFAPPFLVVGSLFGSDAPAISTQSITTSKEARADVYNGQVFACLARDKLMFIPEFSQWRFWNGNLWERCTTGQEMAFAKQVAMHLVNDATKLMAINPEQGEKAMKRAVQAQGANKLEAMLKLAKSESGMSAQANQLDANPLLLGVHNGVVDLKTGALLAPDPKMLMTKSCNAALDREAKCPQWQKFLGDIFPNDPDTIESIQRAIGYTLTGHNTEEKLFICVGYGSNGKSVFGNVVYGIMGDYSRAAAGSVLVSRSKGDTGPRDDLASLAGCRYVGINETQSGDRLDEQVVKMLAGREPITARFMYGSNFTFMPQLTPWLRTNHRPIITGTDEGIWRRLVIIDFSQHFSDEQKDPYLEQKLMAEQDGILAWMIEGCRKYLHEGGLKLSPTIKKASASYREESDILGEFLQTETEQDKNGKTDAALVWRRYTEWCKDGGYHYGTRRTLSRKLKERGYQTLRSNGKDYYTGLHLTPESVGSAYSANNGVFRQNSL